MRPGLIRFFYLYLSFSGGPILDYLMNHYHSPRAQPLYCSVDPDIYYPEKTQKTWKLGYLGTYSSDRQHKVEELLNKSTVCLEAGAFVVGVHQYSSD